jgi:tetratricopeptide (TPR) repeat protein
MATPLVLRVSAAVWRFWWLCGHLTEGRYWLEQALSTATPSEWVERRATALHGAGVLAYHQNDFNAARGWLDEGLALYRHLSDRRGQANILNSLGMVALYQNQYVEAHHLHSQALGLRRAEDDRRGVMISLNNLALIAHYQTDYAGAIELYEECVRTFEDVTDTRVKSAVLGNLGQACLGLGRYDQALPYLQWSLKTDRTLGSRNDSLESIEALGRIAAAQGDGRHAAQLWGAVEALREYLQIPPAPNARHDLAQDSVQLRARLGEAAFSSAWVTGRGLTLNQAIELALRVTPKNDRGSLPFNLP